jgi:YidC/Oxa1 family membrane protein insertase
LRPLYVSFRNPAAAPKDPAEWQLDYDVFDMALVESTSKRCVFSYRDDKVELKKTLRVTGQPYQLAVEVSLKNLAPQRLRHAAIASTGAWRRAGEVEGKMFTVSPYITHVECVGRDGEAKRLQPDSFDSDAFNDREQFPNNQLSRGDWYQAAAVPEYAAISNAYFSDALVHADAATNPTCQLQIQERWDASRYRSAGEDPGHGWLYRARLAYAPAELGSGDLRSYSFLSYVGPKERSALAAGGHNLSELIDLGFFSAIAKVLVAFLLKVYSVIPNWGIAIIILTVTARVLLFPLSVPSIKGMIKMRELKPEIDALNEKYKDDAQAKGIAQMELWRKHKVNPLKGCLPQLASMPVWFALYTTLQTAVELYNIPFLWFPDLSEADPYYILPFIIGGIFFVQQKLMPLQTDPTQQKMMMYFMPGMFTVFMLFLPSGLGVYMFTNSLLGIVQQQVVEWHVRRTSGGRGASPGGADIKVQVRADPPPAAKGSGRRSKKQGSRGAKLSENALLGKGKA